MASNIGKIKMEKVSLVKYDNSQLQKAGNAIAITNKLLEKSEPQLIPHRKGDKWGFCTVDKRIVIDYIYDGADVFSDGMARVRINHKYGFINKKGELVIPCIYDSIYAYEKKEGIKTGLNDYINSLKRDLGRQPSFKELVEDFINHTSKDQTNKNFKLIKLGWELNGNKADYEQVYNDIFSV